MIQAKDLYVAPTKTGKMLKIVYDIEIPGQWEKLASMGYGDGKPKKMQVLVARFASEKLAMSFLEAYQTINKEQEK